MNQEQAIREIQENYREFNHSLNERQRRIWAAREAMKRGWGGIALVSKALRISPNTIKRGIEEINAGESDSTSQPSSRIRKPGGGRKSQKPTLSCAPHPRAQLDDLSADGAMSLGSADAAECRLETTSVSNSMETSKDRANADAIAPAAE